MKNIAIAFIVLFLSHPAKAFTCRDQIQQKVCIEKNSKCSPDTEGLYYPQFQSVYELLPAKLQDALCSQKSIVVRDWKGGPSAWMTFVFRAGVWRHAASLNDFATWKDQLNFGVPNDDNLSIRDDLPKVQSNIPPQYRALYFTVVHELGHHLQMTEEDDYDNWKNTFRRPENNFPNRDKLCSYYCNEAPEFVQPVPLDQISALYRDLMEKSNFLSLYGAGQGSGEDLADTFAYWIINQQLPDSEYWLVLPNGDRYEVMSKLRSPRLKEKRELIEKFYKQTKFNSAPGELRISMPAISRE